MSKNTYRPCNSACSGLDTAEVPTIEKYCDRLHIVLLRLDNLAVSLVDTANLLEIPHISATLRIGPRLSMK